MLHKPQARKQAALPARHGPLSFGIHRAGAGVTIEGALPGFHLLAVVGEACMVALPIAGFLRTAGRAFHRVMRILESG